MTSPPVVGIVGGGQLARMLAEAASPLGIHLRVLAAESDEGAAEIICDVTIGSPDDSQAILDFAQTVDVLTFDHENVDLHALRQLEQSGCAVRPGVKLLEFADKAHQRQRFSEAGLPVPPFLVIDLAQSPTNQALPLQQALEFCAEHADDQGKIVIKASRGGYDGRGVWMLKAEELEGFFAQYTGAPLLLEPKLELQSEVAVLVARNPSGQVAVWPVLETVQVDGMCNEVLLPAALSPELILQAEQIGRQIAELLDAVGVFAVELFVSAQDLLINEIAPRVHNSGHITIEACATSQFSQHLRAILDWPLGPTHMLYPAAVMANVVGVANQDPRVHQGIALHQEAGSHIHLYGKTPRPGRKIGHVSVVGQDLAQCRTSAAVAAAALSSGIASGASPI
ncbi:MAG: 5-(carboxyamino)imidazole ribonucleotide synthase [Microthrixaceae bacterium]